MKYRSPLLFESPLPKTTFDFWDIFPEEERVRLDARKTLISDYNKNNQNNVSYWNGIASINGKIPKVIDKDDELVYFLTIFSSREAELLYQIVNIVEPLDLEIIFLLEDNSRDFITAPSYYIKIGKGIQSQLVINKNFINLRHVLNLLIEKGFPKDQVNEEILYKLMESAKNSGTGHFKDATIAESLIGYLSPAFVLNDYIFSGIGEIIGGISKSLENLKISQTGWNYAIDDPKMKLFFFPFYSPGMINNAEMKKVLVGMKEMHRTIFQSAEKNYLLNPAGNFESAEKVFAKHASGSFVDQTKNESIDKYDQLIDKFLAMIDTGISTHFVYTNAVFCGFWNSFVSAIQGILFLCELAFKLIANAFGLIDQPEKLDHVLQLVADFSFTKLLLHVFIMLSRLIDKLFSMDWTEVLESIRVAHVGYFVGAIVEFIVEIIVGIFVAPGVGAITTVLTKLGKVFSKIIEIIAKIIRKGLGLAEGVVADMSILTLQLLRKGSNGLADIFQEIWLALSEWLDNLPALLGGISEDLIENFKKLGIEIKKVPKPPVLGSGIPIRVGEDEYVLMRNGREIFRGSKKEVEKIDAKLKKMSDEEAEKYLDDLRDRKDRDSLHPRTKKIWEDYTYNDLFPPPSPPKKPCFLAGTLVQTENGKIAIELIEKGTKVLAYNTKNEQTEYKTVLETFTNFTEKYVILTTEQDEVIKVTGAHLFYELTSKNWVAASNLSVGMHLMDDQKNSISIRSISVQKEPQPTYNLEVDDLHNYFVGTNQLILTHNANKKLKFTSEILYDFEFYEYVDYNNKPTYAGQTTQKLDIRANQHRLEFEKIPTKKEFIGASKKLPQEIILNGKPGPYRMTPFEAAVTEMYELNVRGGKRKGLLGLFNKKNPVSESTFDRIKRDFPDFNPCRFYY